MSSSKPKKQKPKQVSWFEYYIADALESLVGELADVLASTRVYLIGGWRCEYCGKIHCRRVFKYKLAFRLSGAAVDDRSTLSDVTHSSDRYVCSLGREALLNGTWTPDNVSANDVLRTIQDELSDTFKLHN